MSAMLELHRELLDRRNMAVLQTILQSHRAGVLEKQEADLALLRIRCKRAQRATKRARAKATAEEDRADALELENMNLEGIVTHREAEQRRVDGNLKMLEESYWAMIDECADVGKKRKSAEQQMQEINDIISINIHKRARMLMDNVTIAGHDFAESR